MIAPSRGVLDGHDLILHLLIDSWGTPRLAKYQRLGGGQEDSEKCFGVKDTAQTNGTRASWHLRGHTNQTRPQRTPAMLSSYVFGQRPKEEPFVFLCCHRLFNN